MPTLRSSMEVSFENRDSRRHGFHTPAKQNRQQTRSAIARTKAKATNIGGQPRTRPPKKHFDDITRNIRYRERVRANELATGDNADTLREKHRWVQEEFDCSRIDGKVTRELHDFYSKKLIGKLEQQKVKAQSLSDAAKEVKQRLEEGFQQRSGARLDDGEAGTNPISDHPAADDEEAGTNPISDHPAAENDAVARQWALDNGFELFSGTGQGSGAGGEEEEGDGIEVKVEKDADE